MPLVARSATMKSADSAALPSWFFSLVLHGCIAMLLVASAPALRRGGAGETSRHVGLVIVQGSAEGTGSGDDDPPAATEAATAADSTTDQAAPPATAEPRGTPPETDSAAAKPPGDEPPDQPAEPAAGKDIDALNETSAQLHESIDGASGNTVGVGEALGRGKGRTRVFGIPGEGYKFVYVFDRSASMGGSGRSTLAAAKRELLKSLQSLGESHQFQIIFYNEKPSILNIAGRSRLVFGTRQNKELARRFVGGITADGATGHEEALLLALRLKPDVIFFLTDADDPALNEAQMLRIHQIADGATTIHTIEFGAGPRIGGDNFLARLAQENGGAYAYFDTTALDEEE